MWERERERIKKCKQIHRDPQIYALAVQRDVSLIRPAVDSAPLLSNCDLGRTHEKKDSQFIDALGDGKENVSKAVTGNI